MSGQFRGRPRCQHPSPTRRSRLNLPHTRLRRAGDHRDREDRRSHGCKTHGREPPGLARQARRQIGYQQPPTGILRRTPGLEPPRSSSSLGAPAARMIRHPQSLAARPAQGKIRTTRHLPQLLAGTLCRRREQARQGDQHPNVHLLRPTRPPTQQWLGPPGMRPVLKSPSKLHTPQQRGSTQP